MPFGLPPLEQSFFIDYVNAKIPFCKSKSGERHSHSPTFVNKNPTAMGGNLPAFGVLHLWGKAWKKRGIRLWRRFARPAPAKRACRSTGGECEPAHLQSKCLVVFALSQPTQKGSKKVCKCR